MKIKTQHIKSAIIGYWRSGAEIMDISLLLGISYSEIEQIIVSYSLKENLK
jgi:hypothetical protein